MRSVALEKELGNEIEEKGTFVTSEFKSLENKSTQASVGEERKDEESKAQRGKLSPLLNQGTSLLT